MPIIKENDKLVEQYKSGNDKALNALVGKVMKIDKSYSAVVIKEELIKLMAE
jgi:aspartyl-tRNA(Asn)/glutamyl-tRNA(Gln) amidotransferase subunit B